MDSIEKVARRLRRDSNLSQPIYSTRKIIEACFPGTIVTGRRLPEGVEEAVSRTSAGIVIVYRRGLSGPEQRFAIAHALGHVIYDHDAIGTGLVIDEFRERRADAFAAELLAPLEQLGPMLDGVSPLESLDDSVDRDLYQDFIDQLASDFGVPAWVIEQRIRDLAS